MPVDYLIRVYVHKVLVLDFSDFVVIEQLWEGSFCVYEYLILLVKLTLGVAPHNKGRRVFYLAQPVNIKVRPGGLRRL